MSDADKPFLPPRGLRTPPQDLAAEQALLGSLMLKPDGIYEVLDSIGRDDFYAEKHRRIYQSMLGLQEKNEPIDLVSMTARLKTAGGLEAVGGAAYLTELLNTVPAASNLGYYGAIVARKAALRRLIQRAEEIAELGYQEHQELDSIIDQAEKAILGIGQFSKRTFVKLKDTLAEAWERFDRLHRAEGAALRGLPTGFRDLDSRLSGLQKSDLVILAARPSMGKTSLALDIARHAACQHAKAVGIFSLEMSAAQLVDRLIAAEGRVDSWKLRTGRISAEDEFSRIRDALDRLSHAPIFIDDEPTKTATKIKSVARKLKAEHGLDLVVVDYLQLMVAGRQIESLVQQVTEISHALKGLARELEVPVLAISQLSRAVEQRGGKPRLSDLRDSGSIEQDADVVIFIHREDRYNEKTDKKNIADIIIAKHRNGPIGEFQLYFDEARVSFHTLEKAEFGGL